MSDPALAAVRLVPQRASRVRSVESSGAADVGVALLLPLEILALTVAFDTWRLDAIPTFWAQLLATAPQILRLASAIAVALVVVDGRRLLGVVRGATRPDVRARVIALGVHLLTIAAFARATSILVDGNVAALAHRPAWTIAWGTLGATSTTAWALALFPARVWTSVWPGLGPAVIAALAGTVAWGFGFVTQEFWKPMADVTFRVVSWTVHVFYGQVIVNPSLLEVGTPTFQVIISPACSGYEGIGLLVGFLSIYLWLFRKELRFPLALLLLPVGALTIWLVNALRIVAMIAIGTSGWPKVAAGGFHSQAGWIAFNAIAIGFVAISSRFVSVEPASRRVPVVGRAGDGDLTVALLAPFFTAGIVGMVTGALSAGFDWLYPLRIVAVAVVCWRFRRQYASLLSSWSFSWWPIGVGGAVCAVWLLLAPASASDKSLWASAVQALPLGWAALWMSFRVIGYVVMAPFVEELAFRGYLMRRLQSGRFDGLPVWRFTWVSAIGSSLLFGALHGSMWIAGTIAGLAFVLALWRRRALGDAVVAHAVANGLLAGYACISGHWSVWS
jgi:exosortase E/protease (VPEID-CTERM system)